jgi:hypothetical protein
MVANIGLMLDVRFMPMTDSLSCNTQEIAKRYQAVAGPLIGWTRGAGLVTKQLFGKMRLWPYNENNWKRMY